MNARYGKSLSVMLRFFAVFSAAALSFATNDPASKAVTQEVKARALGNYGKLPLSFEENRGQAATRVKFLSQGNGYTLLLTPDAVELNLAQPQRDKHAALKMSFPGAQLSSHMTGDGRQATISSYFVGNDPAKWVTGAPNYARVRYQEIYPGVDLVFYGNQRQLEYDLVVAPGADPRVIQMKFDGVDSMRLDSAGNLVLSSGTGEIRQHRPIVYQERDGVRQSVNGRYVIKAHHRIAFEVGQYDTRKPLIIDPVLTFATYLGTPGEELFGLSATADNATYPAVAVDGAGFVYMTGFNGGLATQFPGNPPILTAQGIGGGAEVFVVKMNSSGTALLYSVVFGGGGPDVGGGIAVDTSGNAYVTGYTNSTNFPITAEAPQSSFPVGATTNAFVAKVNAAGNALLYSTYLGGSGSFWGRAIAVDPSGDAYVTGTAQPSGSISFPLVNPLSSTPAAGFLTKVNSAGTSFVYSTFLSAGIGYGITVDSSADAYVAGTTGTVAAPSPAQAYVLKVNPTGSIIDYGPVLLGHSSALLQSIGFGIALDSQEDAYVTGMTNDPSFPVTAGAAQTTYGGGMTDAFAVKLGPTGAPIYATYIGGIGSNILPERGSGIGVDVAGYAYVAGTTQCIGFPVTNVIPGSRNGSPTVLMQGSLSGSTSTWTPNAMAGEFDQVTAIAFDASGDIYAGSTAVNATTGGGIYKSTNGGISFSPATSGIASTSIDAIAVDPNNSANVYAIASGRIYLSTNSGANWTAVGPAVGTSGSLAIAKTSPSTIYAGSSSSLVYSTNNFATWTNVAVPFPVGSLVADPNNAAIAYAGTSSGVYKTTTAGASWSGVNTGLPSASVSSLAINSTSTTLYAATPSGLFYTVTGGTSWTQITELILGIPSTPLLVAVDSGNNVYLAFEGSGIAIGTNGGTAQGDWSGLTYNGLTQNQIVALAVKPGVSGTAFAGIVSATDAFLTRISPDGSSFLSSTCIGGSDNNLGQNIAVSPVDGAVYVSGATISSNFPSTAGVIQPSLAGLYDAFVTGIDFGDQLTTAVSPSNSGTISVNPASPDGQYVFGSTVCLTASPAANQIFTSWTGTPVNAANCLTITSTTSVTANFTTNPNIGKGLRFIPAASCRVVDTRNPDGPLGGPALGAGATRSFTIPGTCGIPTTALAYSLNLTVVPNGTLGYVTLWPTGQPQPVVSTLNSIDGIVKANAAIVPAGTSGAVNVFATDSTNVVLDINGYFEEASDPSALVFYPLAPCRVADTRNATGELGGPSLVGSEVRSFSVLSSTCNIPSNALAYSLNFTAVPEGPLGYLTVWPSGQSQPVVSTLNAPTGEVTANAAIVSAGSAGAIELFVTDDTDMVIDIDGYFAAAGSGGYSLYDLAPCRIRDTRLPAGSPAFIGTIAVTATGVACGVPPEARALVLNATVVPSGELGYLTLWANGGSQPVVSTLNSLDGSVTSNMAVVPTTNGLVDAYAAGPAPTYLILDISGYFAP